MREHLPPDWQEALAPELDAPSFGRLTAFVAEERRRHPVFPPEREVFAAFHATPRERVRVVLVGQDPYHGMGQAHGLSFSVPEGVPLPASLRNLLREWESDLGLPRPRCGNLRAWGEAGVLLLNSVLTVRAGEPGSHRGQGWEEFTQAVLQRVAAGPRPAVFLLLGRDAQALARVVEGSGATILRGVHPSPLSAWRGFFGSRPFSAVNQALAARGEPPIDWRLPDPAAAGGTGSP